MTTCSECNGVGEDLTAGPSINAVDYIPCKACNGSGKEPVMVLSAEEKIKELEAQIELMKEAIADLDRFLDLDTPFHVSGDPAIGICLTIDNPAVINQIMQRLKSFIVQETNSAVDNDHPDPSLVAVVSIIVEEMTLIEANTINMCLMLGTNPVDRMGYDKAKPLFTENNGMKMHNETARIFSALVNKRVREEKG